jgi:hypothetical protein
MAADRRADQEGRPKTGLPLGIIFAFLVSFYWTQQVISNIVHCTSAGAVASWYFLSPNNSPARPTVEALKRATWTSFGSICLGSLIIAVIKALRYLVQTAGRSKNGCVQCMVMCLLNCLERLVTFFNVYAFSQIAIYGKSYCESAHAVWDLLKARGFDLIINDDLVGLALLFASIVGGAVTGVVGAVFAKLVFNEEGSTWIIYAFFGFMIGCGIVNAAMEVVFSGVCAFFVCYAEDPQALQATKPHVAAEFREALGVHPKASQMPLLAGTGAGHA